MGVDYLGIHLDTLTYIALLLFALIIFIILWIIAEMRKQKKNHERDRKRIAQKRIHHLKKSSDKNNN